MKAIRLEFYKCKRRKVMLVCLALIAAQLIWMGVFLARLDEQDIRDGWMLLFYNLALVDAIMLPLTGVSSVVYAMQGAIPWGTLAFVAPGLAIGSLVGARLTGKLSDRTLCRLFGTLMLVAGGWMLL